MGPIVPSPPQTDEHGCTKKDRQLIRVSALRSAATVVQNINGTVSELEDHTLKLGKAFEQFILTGE